MLHILRVTGFHDTAIFFLGKHGDENVYYVEVDDPDEIDARIIMKKLLLHNTRSNTIHTYPLHYPANDFSGMISSGALYYCRYSQKDTFLHIHRLNFSPIHSSEIIVPLADMTGNATINRTEMKGIDERYCLFGCSTSETFETTHLLLIDFKEETYYNMMLNLGLEGVPGIERIFKIKDSSIHPHHEQIILITGGFHWTEKYEVWKNKNSALDILTEQVMAFEKESFFRNIKAGRSLEALDKILIEHCNSQKSIISYDYNEAELIYTVADFDKNKTSGMKYNVHSGLQKVFEYESTLSEPVYINSQLFSVETLDHGRRAILDLNTNKIVVILASDENLLAIDEHNLITFKWLNSGCQQLIYLYDLTEEPLEQKFLGIGYSHYYDKQLTIFS